MTKRELIGDLFITIVLLIAISDLDVYVFKTVRNNYVLDHSEVVSVTAKVTNAYENKHTIWMKYEYPTFLRGVTATYSGETSIPPSESFTEIGNASTLSVEYSKAYPEISRRRFSSDALAWILLPFALLLTIAGIVFSCLAAWYLLRGELPTWGDS